MMNEEKYSVSAARYSEARKYLSGGVSSHFRLGMKPFPLFFEAARGSKLYDADGHEYIDYAMGMGPVILGHADAVVNSAVAASLAGGQIYAGQHRAELELAREICAVVPCAEMVRFSMSGSEAIQGAIRVARAYTGRSQIIKFEGQYHGWFDNVFVSVHPDENKMGPEQSPNTVAESLGQDPRAFRSVRVLPWNNIEILRSRLESDNDIAAILMEPIMCNTGVILPKPGYLEEVRQLCHTHGVLLIFDEVITGFRVSLGGAQKLLNVTPDIAVFAKAMGNGYAISCIAGRSDIMEFFCKHPVVHGGTFNSNLVSCTAALATIRYLRENEKKIYSQLEQVGTMLVQGLRQLNEQGGYDLVVQGLPTVFHTMFTKEKGIFDYRSHQLGDEHQQTAFVYGLQEEGVRVTGRGTWFLSAAHTEADIDRTLSAAQRVIANTKARDARVSGA